MVLERSGGNQHRGDSAPPEPIGTGRRITCRDMVNRHFPEGSYPPREQIYDCFKLFHQLIAPSQVSFYLSPETLFPLIRDNNLSDPASSPPLTPDVVTLPGSIGSRLRTLDTSGPQFTFFVGPDKQDFNTLITHVKTTVLRALEGGTNEKFNFPIKSGSLSTEEIYPSYYGLPKGKTRIFKMINREDRLNIAPDTSLEPIIIIEETESSRISPSFSLRLVVENPLETSKIPEHPELKTLFQINFKSIYSHEEEWDLYSNYFHTYFTDDAGPIHVDRRVRWIVDVPEPYGLVTDQTLATLKSPIELAGGGRYREGWFNFHVPPSGDRNVELEREYTPSYYLDLLIRAAKIIYHGVEDYARPVDYRNDTMTSHVAQAVSQQTRYLFDNEFTKNLPVIYRQEFRSWNLESPTQYFSPIEYMMYELLWNGKDIWRDIHDFTFMMAKAAEKYPGLFLSFARELGLSQMIPAFREIENGYKTGSLLGVSVFLNMENPKLQGLEKFCEAFHRSLPETPQAQKYKRREKEDVWDYFARIISPIPSLLPYRNHTWGKELAQSNRYFMELALAKAMYNDEIGEMPIAACLVHEGRVISTLGNKGEELFGHAETRVIKQAKKLYRENLQNLEGSRIYSTLGPCNGCITTIRQNAPWITDIIYGLATKWKNKQLMYALPDSIFPGRRPRYVTPPIDSIFSRKLQYFYRSLEKYGRFHDLLPLEWYPDFNVLEIYLKHIQNTTPLYYPYED